MGTPISRSVAPSLQYDITETAFSSGIIHDYLYMASVPYDARINNFELGTWLVA